MSNGPSMTMHEYNPAQAFSMPVKRIRKLSRPSTAPAVEENLKPLLASHLPAPFDTVVGVGQGGYNGMINGRRRTNGSELYMQTVEEEEGEKKIDGFSPPVSSENCGSMLRDLNQVFDYDWSTFINCYAAGRWDPHRTPNPPKAHTDASHPPPTPSPQEITSPAAFPFPLRTGMPLILPTHRMRNSFSTTPSSSTVSFPTPNGTNGVIQADNADLQASVATMRWASARVNFAPLSLPSPEHELTDPMRGVTAMIPGSHPPEPPLQNGHELLTPGGSRRTKLAHFWKGTQDVEDSAGDRYTAMSTESTYMTAPSTSIQPPVDDDAETDYFGSYSSFDTPQSTSTEDSPIMTRSLDPGAGPSSAPTAMPHRIHLTRQSSAPLPSKSSSNIHQISDSSAAIRLTRALKEEQMFNELGFLAPPNPPDELQRRQALYKFNIWHTGADVNFDRIAHLAKLVFNTKGVHISLLDAGEQFLKSEWGLKERSLARIHSICGHSILQRGDEPMVVLDTQQDWRFAKNPYICGTPNIRFYAGAPLRTSDGYNIGCLAVLDDTPREDFSPRQRHTLKEFAAIVMREMELWKDKIQLRIRDRIQNSMEQFSRECLEIDSKTEANQKEKGDRADYLKIDASMDRVYDRAAKLIQRTLDVSGVCVMDVSHCEVIENMNSESTVSVVMHHGNPSEEMTSRQLTAEEYWGINAFFGKYPEGKIFDGIAPLPFRPFLPTKIQYALTVPIFNVDKRPFALLYAYNDLEHPQRFLEGHELSYMRAIGVIILSAVLKRRMILADKAKSLFISNISHELRTPLHGILAAAELLSDSPLNHNQISFLETVQACGTSLVETVNHVLDFTKLSGNAKAGGVEHVIVSTKVDLMHLIEEATDGCFIGYRARTSESAIGSVYSPPRDETLRTKTQNHVETIIDIGHRKTGWMVKCEKGGIRRILMNIFSNSLKFTQDGYVHVMLRELPSTPNMASNEVKIELSVSDTGKGISQAFLKNQLFHPFSQENPLQTGTGLGLAIVNSIVQSDSVRGKLDVWSEENVGTEIKVYFTAITEQEEAEIPPAEMAPIRVADGGGPVTVSLQGFGSSHRGLVLLERTLRTYLGSWWGFNVLPNDQPWGQIVILNEDYSPVVAATQRRDTSRPFIVLLETRGNPDVLAVADEHDNIGGFCRMIYKPVGPSKLWSLMKLCVHTVQMSNPPPSASSSNQSGLEALLGDAPFMRIPRRKSEDGVHIKARPRMMPRSMTASPVSPPWLPSGSEGAIAERPLSAPQPSTEATEDELSSTILVGNGGTLLKSSVGSVGSKRQLRVLVVEDNNILRNLLVRWLQNRGYDPRDAVNGRDGVEVYKSDGPFDVVLLDLSMPVLDGIGATAEIRKVEESQPKAIDDLVNGQEPPHARILALTGMSSLEDKRRAFEAGVDGYLVKPVAFKTLGEMFSKLGVEA